ncbi:hypothetical protein C0J52_17872 [Blattella germanica]|nr:hypothetical protein C0J52_17872 [Blattella germanica]
MKYINFVKTQPGGDPPVLSRLSMHIDRLAASVGLQRSVAVNVCSCARTMKDCLLNDCLKKRSVTQWSEFSSELATQAYTLVSMLELDCDEEYSVCYFTSNKMANFVPGSAGVPTSEVELTISCRNLLDCDVFSKSDPFCITYLKNIQQMGWQEIARTETIMNTLNPDFVKKRAVKDIKSKYLHYSNQEQGNVMFMCCRESSNWLEAVVMFDH